MTIAGTPCVIDFVTSTEIQCVTEPVRPSVKDNVRVEISGNGIARQVLSHIRSVIQV